MNQEFLKMLAEEVARRDPELGPHIKTMTSPQAVQFMRHTAANQIAVAAAAADVAIRRATTNELMDLIHLLSQTP